MTKYNGMTQQQLIEVAKQAYSDFRSTFEKPTDLVSIDEVMTAHKALETTCKELRSLASDEIGFWYQYRNNNNAWLEWQQTHASIDNIGYEAWQIVETKDWSIYKD